jgi:hypothetical protein
MDFEGMASTSDKKGSYPCRSKLQDPQGVRARPRMCQPTHPGRCPRCTVTQVELSGSDVLCGTNVGARSEGGTMDSGNSSVTPSGRLTASEWAAVVSSLAFITIWLGISFA